MQNVFVVIQACFSACVIDSAIDFIYSNHIVFSAGYTGNISNAFGISPRKETIALVLG